MVSLAVSFGKEFLKNEGKTNYFCFFTVSFLPNFGRVF
jgi:hypothetical protein